VSSSRHPSLSLYGSQASYSYLSPNTSTHNAPVSPNPPHISPATAIPSIPLVHIIAPSPVPPARSSRKRGSNTLDTLDAPSQPAPGRRQRVRKTPTNAPGATLTPAIATPTPNLVIPAPPALTVRIAPTMIAPTSPTTESNSSGINQAVTQELTIIRPTGQNLGRRVSSTSATDVWYHMIPVDTRGEESAPSERPLDRRKPSEKVYPMLRCKWCRYAAGHLFIQMFSYS
jgi:hypothetical protein